MFTTYSTAYKAASMRNITTSLAIALFATACSPPITPVPQAGEVHQLQIEWRIVDREELEATYKLAGMPITKNEMLQGFAGRLPDGRTVVYTLPPQRVDDQATCTLGHEILHVTHGSYHE